MLPALMYKRATDASAVTAAHVAATAAPVFGTMRTTTDQVGTIRISVAADAAVLDVCTTHTAKHPADAAAIVVTVVPSPKTSSFDVSTTAADQSETAKETGAPGRSAQTPTLLRTEM